MSYYHEPEVSMGVSMVLIVSFLLLSILASCLPCCPEELAEDTTAKAAERGELEMEQPSPATC